MLTSADQFVDVCKESLAIHNQMLYIYGSDMDKNMQYAQSICDQIGKEKCMHILFSQIYNNTICECETYDCECDDNNKCDCEDGCQCDNRPLRLLGQMSQTQCVVIKNDIPNILSSCCGIAIIKSILGRDCMMVLDKDDNDQVVVPTCNLVFVHTHPMDERSMTKRSILVQAS